MAEAPREPLQRKSEDIKQIDKAETKKRHREVGIITFVSLLFLVLAGLTFKIFGITEGLPLEHSLFFFGLVNFNLIVLLLLAFLIFRNVVKVFSEREKGVFGRTLKGKLIAAFVGFSAIPTTIIFFVSVLYIKTSVEKWSNPQLGQVLRNAIDISVSYITSTKERNYDFAYKIEGELKKLKDPTRFSTLLDEAREQYNLDAVEYYTDRMIPHHLSISPDVSLTVLPEVSSKHRRRVVEEQIEMSDVHNFNGESLVRVLIPVSFNNKKGAIVVTSIIPNTIPRNIGNIEATYNSLKGDRSPIALLEPFYIVVLIFVTLVILLCATWFGFYLAKQLTIPIERLTQAAKSLTMGLYPSVEACRSSPEMNLLINNFNKMVSDLKTSQIEIKEANENLKTTLTQLDEHSRYINVVLSNVSTGVISVDKEGVITMVNRYAARLFHIKPQKYVGQKAVAVPNEEHRQLFENLLKTHNVGSIQREINVAAGGRTIPMQITLSFLNDESGKELGKVLVFNDLSVLISAQRSAAWKEVARRIAHEIKNPLTPIRLSAQRLQRKFGTTIEDPAFYSCIQMIISQVDDLKTLVNEFSHFARLPQSHLTMSSLNKVISEAMMLFIQAHKRVSFTQSLDSTLPEFLFDPDQIKRVVTNLVDNSLSATKPIKGQSEIKIRTEYDKLLKIVRISVIDNGPGIPANLRDRIFEPYMTTKKDGTGLGLSIVKRVIDDHNGFIRALNHHPKGTRIVVELPVIIVNTTSRILPIDQLDELNQQGPELG